jgi:uncharacterized membrane protein YozB (DUF420 family)
MEPNVKKAMMIAAIVLFTVFLIHRITNSAVGSSKTTTSKTVIVDNDPQRHYYGFGTPAANHYNSYKAQYYN